MLKIGIDFDNTIACYDQVFFHLASDHGVPNPFLHQSKPEIKKLVHDYAGDLLWQKMQGLAYGQEMHRAQVFPGFLEFLMRSLISGNQIYIVSHKTEFGHCDPNKVSLREASKCWIRSKLLNPMLTQLGFDLDHIFFETTRDQKIDRINKIGCNIFIDDLTEVIEHQNLHVPDLKIHFTSSDVVPKQGIVPLNSWYKISDYLYGKISFIEILGMANIAFSPYRFDSIELHRHGGNSSVLKLKSGNIFYALKIYPTRDVDLRPRLVSERIVCGALGDEGFNVPKMLSSSDELNWALFEWVDGECPSPINHDFIEHAANFIVDLQRNDIRSKFSKIGLGTEACTSPAELFRQVNDRLNKLLTINNVDLSQFMTESLRPLIEDLQCNAMRILGSQYSRLIDRREQILSPGDFGAHNAFLILPSEYSFFDFEYFGWDDPVKLISDFYWHPGMELKSQQKEQWLESIIAKLDLDQVCLKRLSVLMPIFGIRWCLIMLRRFPTLLESSSDSGEFEHLTAYCDNQLSKSKNMFNQIYEMVLNGYPLKIS